MPGSPYQISGTVKKGPREGYDEVTHTVDTGVGSGTVNLFLDSGTTLAQSQTVYIYNITQGQVVTATTNSVGQYLYDLADMTAYANGDELRIWSSDISATRRWDVEEVTGVDDSTAKYKPEAHQNSTRIVKAGREGKEHTEDYPESVNVMNFIINSENPNVVYAYSGGLLQTETVTIKGNSYKKTYTYSGGQLTAESAWEAV